ncbi:hypothetical protein [Streptomyces sp. NPDC008150]|uniref:hypothetical protein n=1 Tax=Streptomyces sp. NPDC008150 TaxID=3364816 RepID=UPI0036EF2325
MIALSLCAITLGVLALALPRRPSDVVDATQFSIAFFATLLTGEAVIFAISFSAASSWPSLGAIDSHIAFREWVLIGWFAALFTACGLLGDSRAAATYGALLFLLSNIYGIFSFARLFGLAGVSGRNRLLRQTLAAALTWRESNADTSQGPLQDDPVVSAYLGAVSQTAGANDPTAVRNLVDQLVAAPVPAHATRNIVVVHLDVLHRLTRATLVSGADPVVITGCAAALIDSLIERSRQLPDPATALGAASRYLAWLANSAHLMSVRGVASNRAARELVVLALDSRLKILRQVDPDPKSAASPDELGSILPGPLSVLLWIRDFTELHGAHQAGALYGVYEILTGTKFMGNYWDGASVLADLRRVLYTDTDPLDTPESRAAREVLCSVAEFDRFWALVSVGALATLRDVRQPHPPELVRPEFTPDHQLLGAYVRGFAAHRWFTTAAEARDALVEVLSHAATPGTPMWELHKILQHSDYDLPVPRTNPEHRPAGTVLAVACRLAPLLPEDSDDELRSFLEALPEPVRAAVGALAVRTLPGAAEAGDPVEAVVRGLRVLQLVGAHTRTAP